MTSDSKKQVYTYYIHITRAVCRTCTDTTTLRLLQQIIPSSC